MKFKHIVLASAVLSLGACATVTKGSNNTVKVTSEPSDAKVVFKEVLNKYDGAECRTPCEVELKRKGNYETTVSKDGYAPFTTILVPKISTSGGAGMAGNILLGGVIGAGVDAATGAMKDLSPNPLRVVLAPEGEESYMVDKDGNKVDPVIGEEKGEESTEEESEAEGEPVALNTDHSNPVL